MQAILNCDKNWGIGRGGSLLFRLPRDMKFFREETAGKTVVMGAGTLRSLPGARPLKNRTNIVLSSSLPDSDAAEKGYILVRSLPALLEKLKEFPREEVYIIGGGSVYRALLSFCERALVTKVDADDGADVFFPNLDETPGWSIEKESEPVSDNGLMVRFTTYVNSAAKPL